MLTKLRSWWHANRVILENSGSLVGSTVVTSALGFIFWWAAARFYSPEAVGLASAAVSAMSLLAAIAVVGLATLLVTELPRRAGVAGPLISAALWTAGALGALLALGFGWLAPALSPDFGTFWGRTANVVIFAVGTSAMTMAGVVDNAMVGLLRGSLQLHRMTVFAVVKLAAVALGAAWLGGHFGSVIFGSWVVGIIASLATLAATISMQGGRVLFRPEWGLLRRLSGSALGHHALNMAIQVPTLLLPVLVTAKLSAVLNASFYASWMLVSFTFMVPSHLSQVLLAVGSGKTREIAPALRFTLRLSTVFALAMISLLMVGARPILGLFGATYVENGVNTLRILSLGILPIAIRSHFIAISRLTRHVGRATAILSLVGILELGLAVLGSELGGLTGLSAGVTAAFYLEGLITGPAVLRAARAKPARP